MFMMRFDMRAPAFGAPTTELYPAALEMASWAESRGADQTSVRDALIAAANARIDQAVANGRLPADRAGTLKAKVPDLVTKLMTRTWGQHRTV